MPVTIKVNGTVNSLVHKFSNGISAATIPDVCKTPSPGGPVPIPYPNIAQSITLSNGTTTVKGDKAMAAIKGSKFAMSNGDNPGVAGGVKSSTFMKEATWILYSFDTKMNGKNCARFMDKMFHNHENAANLAGVIQSVVAAHNLDDEEVKLANEICEEVCKAAKKSDDGEKLAEGKHHQDEIAKRFSNGPPRHEPKTGYENLLTEATWGLPDNVADALIPCLSKSRLLGGLAGVKAPSSQMGAINTLRKNDVPGWRPDFTLLKDKSQGMTEGNVKRYFEVKIDDKPTKNQAAAKDRLKQRGESNKLVELDRKSCGC
ncbi:DUF4150 domain-containing protein [Roseateles sp. MS654]|uniref:DUF4150 domain-containing protein n=1 Tax=Roseateles sp. MS654 TaxID=3412685 RepID=UPI003C3028A5